MDGFVHKAAAGEAVAACVREDRIAPRVPPLANAGEAIANVDIQPNSDSLWAGGWATRAADRLNVEDVECLVVR